MDIYSPTGTKVRFVESNKHQVSYGRHDDPDIHLTRGDVYTVAETEVHSSYTAVRLKELPGYRFNSCSFEAVKDK